VAEPGVSKRETYHRGTETRRKARPKIWNEAKNPCGYKAQGGRSALITPEVWSLSKVGVFFVTIGVPRCARDVKNLRVLCGYCFLVESILLMVADRKIRVLVAKPGLDGHDRGAKVIARALRDAGMEVIYTGLRQTPEMIVNSALQEDVDVIGLSILSGAHNAIVPRVSDLLRQNKMEDVLFLIGGIIPEQDFEFLKKAGVSAIFNPGTPMDDIAVFIRKNVKPRGLITA
jgi:methylmalonyl-CoA mutase C-terminal domain/subunit